MPEPRIGLYPGTFDPVTNGHMDIISRAALLVDQLIVGVAVNAGKGPLFSVEDRIAMVEEETAALGNAEAAARIVVQPIDGLLVAYAAKYGVRMIVRGLRAISDFEYEFQMASMNRRLDPHIETVFLMASDRHHFISSRFVKEIAGLGGDVAQFVSPRVKTRLDGRFAQGAKVLSGAASKVY
jgi:pantetheine-phosphate adenylyltransferase